MRCFLFVLVVGLVVGVNGGLLGWLYPAPEEASLGKSYRLPWRKFERKDTKVVTKHIFDRIGTYDKCKRQVGDSINVKLGPERTLEDLDNIEQRKLQIFLGLSLTTCHLREHGRDVMYDSTETMSPEDFAIYTQFLLAIEDTLVSKLGHERWQRSVEMLVTTVSTQLESTSVKTISHPRNRR